MQQLQPDAILQGGKYKILKTLGQGGFGITYLAHQSGLERKVAIKEFFMKEHCERDMESSRVTLGTEGSREKVERFRAKFLKEARNIAKLTHPHIVHVIDVFEENGTAYYVMEYAEKGSLSDKVGREGPLPEPVATRYILQVADALRYIHQRKMNHLDVKPANIMLNENGDVVLIDFGLSKQYDSNTGGQTSSTPVGISEGYAPLEQYNTGGVSEFSPETDIYSLGATFFKLLTGDTPPSASVVNEVGVPVDRLKAKGVSDRAIAVIGKAMEGRKKDRMKTVDSFVEGLKSSTADPGNQYETPNDSAQNHGNQSADDDETRLENDPKKPGQPSAKKNTGPTNTSRQPVNNNNDRKPNSTWFWVVPAIVFGIMFIAAIAYVLVTSDSGYEEEYVTDTLEIPVEMPAEDEYGFCDTVAVEEAAEYYY